MRSVSPMVRAPCRSSKKAPANMTRAALPGGERLGFVRVPFKIATAVVSNHPATHARSCLEHFLAPSENVVQGVLEVRCRFGKLLSDLLDVLFVALLDLLSKQLLQRTRTHSLIAFLRMVRHHVRNERAGESFRFLVRVVREERVDRNL